MLVRELIALLNKAPADKLIELEANTDINDCEILKVFVQGDVVVLSAYDNPLAAANAREIT